MVKVLLFAGLAAIGNAIFVYGQRSAGVSPNPFLYMAGAVFFCSIMFVAASILFTGENKITYVVDNWRPILIGAVGFFITFVGFYLMYSRVGANSYVVYATLAILTTSVGVGMVIFREPFNIYHLIAVCLAILSVCFYGYGQSRMALN
jgi:drug/metabolite transporter (DMT)-like permease